MITGDDGDDDDDDEYLPITIPHSSDRLRYRAVHGVEPAVEGQAGRGRGGG